jgi:hypothetical protein
LGFEGAEEVSVILAEISKFVGAKLAAAVISVAVVAAGIWCWQHPETVRAFGTAIKLSLVWIVIVAALPWTSFLFVRPLLRFQSDSLSTGAAGILGIAMIAAYWLIDILLAFWLADWSISGTMSWLVVLVGLAAAAVYNFVICESLARNADR